MTSSEMIHLYAYDTMVDLSQSHLVTRALRQLAYAPPPLCDADLQALSTPALALWPRESSWVQQQVQGDVHQDIVLGDGPAKKILFIYQGDEFRKITDFEFLKAFLDRARALYPEALLNLMVFTGDCGGVLRGEGIMHVKSSPEERLKTLRAHLDKTLSSQPELHQRLMIERGDLIDVGVYQARKVQHHFGEAYALAPGEPVEYCIEHRGVNFELYARLRADSDVLVVLGQSAVARRGGNHPVFHRWSWAEELPYSVLVLNDPTLYMHPKIMAGCFQGTPEHYYSDTMVQIVAQFARQLNLANERVLWFGASAGGFSSMAMATALRGSHALVQIPQVDLTRYSLQSPLEDVRIHCYGGMPVAEIVARFAPRISVIEAFRAARHIPNIWYQQNSQDTNHLVRHYATFTEGVAQLMIDLPEVRGADVVTEFFDILKPARGGHTPMNRPDTLACIHRAVERFILRPRPVAP